MRIRLLQVLLAVLAFAVLPAVARADTTIDVTSTADAPLSFGGDTSDCVTGEEGTGPCTLRAAVELADIESDGDPVTINLPAGTYDLTIPFANTENRRASDSGFLEAGNPVNLENTDLTIVGAGAGTTKIDASAIDDHVFVVDQGSSLTMSGVTVTGGDVQETGSTPGFLDGLGGGIASEGTLSLDHVVVTGNTAYFDGGGIASLNGNLQITNSTISNNIATSGVQAEPSYGGGIEINQTFGSVDIDQSTISNNTADYGGGIDEFITFEEGPIQNVNGPIVETTFANNTARIDGGGIYLEPFAFEHLNFDTFDHNTAQGEGTVGGNISVVTPEISSARPTPGRARAALQARPNVASIEQLQITGTIVANGSPVNCTGADGITDLGYNYTDDDGTGCDLDAGNDLLNQTPALGPLADNGGPTQTIALLTGNAAIDYIKDASVCTAPPPPETGARPNAVLTGLLTVDQRGLSRPFALGCDVGALEQHDAAMGVGNGSANPGTVNPNQSTTITQTVTDGGPAPGTNAVYTGTVPAGVSLTGGVTATSNANPAARAFAPRATVACTVSGQTITCPLGVINTVPVDPSDPGAQSWSINMVVNSAISGVHTIVGHVTADQTNPNPAGSTLATSFTVGAAAVAPISLRCTHRPLVLVDVFQKGSRVRLFGAADKSLVGKTANIVFFATHKTVAHAKIGVDGLFSTTAPLPARAIRSTNKARYEAVVGKKKSLDLKLARRVVIEPLKTSGSKVVLTGHVVAPLLSPRPKLVVQRRTSCKQFVTVKRFKMPASGRYKLTVSGTGSAAAAVYRVTTQVRLSKRINRRYPTFSLPQVLGFG